MPKNMPKNMPKELQKYFRSVISCPEGKIVHDADCSYWMIHICDCGLLKALLPYETKNKWYPNFYEEWQKHHEQIDKVSLILNS